jgi:membrane protease YdiL (CAAX protease family)
MFLRPAKSTFILENEDSFLKRIALLSFSIAIWWGSEHYLRPLCGSAIQGLRNVFGNGPFIQNVFSQSLPVDIVCFLMLLGFCALKILPWPQVRGSISKVAKEGTLWGLLICIPTIPLALYLGFKLGFAPNWQNILGNVISNTYEELTYRVFLFSIAAYAFRSVWVGIFIASILFASIHNQYPFSMQLIVALASVFFSGAYLRSRSVLGALWAHELSDMILDSVLLG